jgi:hypothetical protein
MLGKNGVKVFDHIFLHKLTLKFLGDHSLTPCICIYSYEEKYNKIEKRHKYTRLLFTESNENIDQLLSTGICYLLLC